MDWILKFTKVLDLNYKKTALMALLVGMSTIIPFLLGEDFDTAQKITMGIFVGAALLWMTEAIPPFATAIMVIVLQVYLLGKPGGPLDLGESGILGSYQIFLNPIASPIIVLFFGGFILAAAASKHGFDRQMASLLIRPFGRRPSRVLLGVIGVTGLFSMFMSNTATTAMMIAIVLPLLNSFKANDPFRSALILAVPFAANLGGIGTIIGTPPNAVAASILQGMGHEISFIEWMYFGVPLAVILMGILWMILRLRFKPREEDIELDFGELPAISRGLMIVSSTFTVTVILWMTEQFHGIPSAVVALVPIAVFTALGIIDADDLKLIEWNILILVAGGLSLGVAMQQSGLSDELIAHLPLEGIAPFLIIVVLGLVTVTVSNFMSNTAAANLLIPLVTSMAVWSPLVGAIFIALSASLAMSLPISTPPNAIAYATRVVDTRVMAVTGTIVSAIALVILFAVVAAAMYAGLV